MKTKKIPLLEKNKITLTKKSDAPCCGTLTSDETCCAVSEIPNDTTSTEPCCTPETKGKLGCC